MDKIKKKINLEDFIIRFPKEEDSNWGKVANDFEVYGTTISGLTELPLLITENEEGSVTSAILRYGTMINVLTWLNNFIKYSKIYQICYRKGNKKAIIFDENIDLEKYTGETIEFVKEIPSELSGETGNLLWVNENYEQFIKYFTSIYYANEFLKFAKNNKKEIGDTTGYLDIPLYIEEELADMGQFTSNVDFWVENKRYYLNDVAMDDNGDVWRLVKCKDREHIDYMKVPTYLNEFIETAKQYKEYKFITNVSEVAIDISGKSPNDVYVYISGNSGNFYYVRAYYNGPMDEEGYWEYKDISETGRTGSGITAITESKLLSLRRKKKSYDDDSNELPFIVNNSGETELQYSVGTLMNIINVGEKRYYDYIESVFIENNDLIYFKYHIGAWDIKNEEGVYVKVGEGVIYEEEYPYEIKEHTCNYDGVEKTFNYISIDYTCQIKNSGMELNRDKLYSVITVDEDTIKSDDFQAVAYFKDENLLGIQKINENIDINIERGKSAANERHQVLGEISSFDDLINYKNGFFTLKSD